MMFITLHYKETITLMVVISKQRNERGGGKHYSEHIQYLDREFPINDIPQCIFRQSKIAIRWCGGGGGG